MKKEELSQKHRELVKAIVEPREISICRALSTLTIMKNYLRGRDHLNNVNFANEGADLENMIDIVIENLDDATSLICEVASNPDYIVDYKRYEAAREERKHEKQ